MAISRIKLPLVPNKVGVVPLCIVSSGTSTLRYEVFIKEKEELIIR